MWRAAEDFLASWAGAKDRKPLILRGARQTGKTWLVLQAARATVGDCVVVNFEREPDLVACFEPNDPKAILSLLSARLRQSILPGKSLLFLDEIQAAGQVLAKLRWFHEELPQLHVVAAGSLLDFALGDHTWSMPVGRVSYAHLEPMTFSEFLLACGEEGLLAHIRGCSPEEGFPIALHDRAMELVREYALVGGMPAAVRTWTDSRSYAATNQVQRDLLQTIRDDFAKYAVPGRGQVNTLRIAKVFAALPRLVGRKFMPAAIDREEKSLALKDAFRLLSMARIVTPVRRTLAGGLPLGAEVDERYDKVCLLDVGLFSTLCGVDPVAVRAEDLTLVNQGQLAEQWVGQELRAGRPLHHEPELFTWVREARNSNAEVDYVLAVGGSIVPVEVKAGATGRLRSLHMMMLEKGLDFGVRVCSQPMQLGTVDTALPIGPPHRFRLLTIPFYLVGELSRLIAAARRPDARRA